MRCFVMRCFVVSMIAALLVCSSAPARAELIVADDFSYSDGPLDNLNGGSAGSGSSWSGSYQSSGWNVSGGQITASSGAYTDRYFSTGFSGSPAAPLYFSARFRMSSIPTGSSTTDRYVLQSIFDDNWTGIAFGIWWDRDDPGVLQPYVRGYGWSGSGTSRAGTYTADTEVLIVGKIEFNVDGNKERLQIWVNPTNVETSTQYSAPVAVNIEWTTPTFIYIENNSDDDYSSSFDDMRLGDTWADVGPVPEPSTLALLATGLIGLLYYAWRKRK